MKLLVLTIITLLINLSKQFFIIIEAFSTNCINKHLNANDHFSGSYLISGENEESCKISITNEQHESLWEIYGKKNGSFNMPIVKDGTYFLCVHNTFSKQIAFSFDFIDHTDDKALSIENISNLNSFVHSVRKKMDIIGSHMSNAKIRRQSHFQISQTFQSSISFYTFIKIAFIFLFSGFQIYMITSAFSNIKVTDRVYLGISGSHTHSSENAIL